MDTTNKPAVIGLSSKDAAARLKRCGPNDLPRQPRRTVRRILLEVVREPMLQLLAMAVTIYWMLGDHAEASVLLIFLSVIVLITVIQEWRTERVLEALHAMTSPRAQVWRDGQRLRIAGSEVVEGDTIELVEGDRVPADAKLLQANDLAIDESLLSGESLPVSKCADPRQAKQAQNVVRAGTLVVAGQGTALVTATGSRSEIGKIGLVLGTIETQVTPLQKQVRHLIHWFSYLGLTVSLLVALLFVWTRGDWLDAALAGITMAMSMLPQEFLLILTVFMAMGAWRLSQHHALTRRAATIEALGAATVLCTDKTGTLTRNEMAIERLVRFEETRPIDWHRDDGGLDTRLTELLRIGVLACEEDPSDAMERAFHKLAASHLKPQMASGNLVHEYGLTPELPVMTHVWQFEGEIQPVVAAKGAPESVVKLCRLPEPRHSNVLQVAAALAGQGMRVLAVASATWRGPLWPETPHGYDFQLLGLVGLADPLRRNVPNAIHDCQQAGIRVVMITGDHPGTALAIAREAGIETLASPLLGAEIASMDDQTLRQQVATNTVFARVAPQQKLRIVQALKANGQIVAMTGDGVNDAPSLKAADIGIAMGGRGTDVAREASSLVLLDDNFATLVKAIRLGRRIDDNLRKAMQFVFAVHVPIAGLTLLPLLFGWPLLFTPMHIAFLEIAIDPVCSIAFEAEKEEQDVMKRPPRDPSAALFSSGMILLSLLQGGVVLLSVALFYWGTLTLGWPEGEARSSTFIALVIANVGLILVNRSSQPNLARAFVLTNKILWGMIALTVALLGVILGVPTLRDLFGFAVPDTNALLCALLIGAVVILLLPLQSKVAFKIRRPSTCDG